MYTFLDLLGPCQEGFQWQWRAFQKHALFLCSLRPCPLLDSPINQSQNAFLMSSRYLVHLPSMLSLFGYLNS